MKKLGSIIFLFCLYACQPKEQVKNTLFKQISSDHSHIRFENKVESTDDFNIIEYLYFYNGAGVAIGDINNDGLLDIYFTSNKEENHLYLNKGSFEFEDITSSAGVGGASNWSNGVTMADVNADGLLDIYVSVVADYKGLKGHNELYINNGDLTFSEKSAEYGLDFQGFGTQAAFFDYDGDSDLDIYLLNHSVHDASSYGPSSLREIRNVKAGDLLLENKLNEGELKFEDVTLKAGIHSSRIGYGLGLAIQDVNADGWQDIYVSNDFHENDYLYINQGNGTFKEQLEQSIPHTSRYSMGNDMGDVNNDGYPEIITLDMLPYQPNILMKSVSEDKMEVSEIKTHYGYAPQLVQNTLQLNLKNGNFSDMSLYSGVYATDWSWSPLIADFDNDGLKDIHITNGIYKRPNDLDYIQYLASIKQQEKMGKSDKEVTKSMIDKMPTLKISNGVFKNNGQLKFENVGNLWGLDEPSYSNGSAYGDLDNDGDLDLVINNVNQEAMLFENTSENKSNHFIKLRLNDDHYNTFGLGAQVTIYADSITITNQLTATHGFESSSEPALTIGLGSISHIDSLKITWVGGKYQMIYNVDTDQLLQIKKSNQLKMPEVIEINPWFQEVDSLISYKHQENRYRDFNSQFLLPYKVSTKGPAISKGDINGDGLEDLYVGGAYGQAGQLFIQKSSGILEASSQPAFSRDSFYEDTDAEFADLDNDGDMDLVVVSGGGQYKEGAPLLRDRIYLNNQGEFVRMPDFGALSINSSCLTIADYNNDGYKDIFIGADVNPEAYGIDPAGYLLVNKQGNFELNTSSQFLGMLTDAQWADIDNDNDLDLLLVGHWMPVTVLLNNEGDLTERVELPETQGLWNCIKVQDFNNDGLNDIVAGNFGLNNKFKLNKEYPLKLFAGDFDGNGRVEPIIMQYLEGRYIPVMTKDDLAKQMPSVNKKFNTYKEYAEELDGIETFLFSDDVSYEEKEVVETRSMVFYNTGNHTFKSLALPLGAQKSTVNTIIVDDINKDEKPDIIAAGNLFDTHINLGRYDGSYGELLINNGQGFDYIPSKQSDLLLKGQVRAGAILENMGEKVYIFGLNDDRVATYIKTQ